MYGKKGVRPTLACFDFSHFVTLCSPVKTLSRQAKHSESKRAKRLLKPTAKLIENRLQSDSLKLEKIWERTSQAISKLKETPDSVEALRKAVGDLRSSFSDYELAWISLMDFTVHASLPEHQEERQTVEAMMRTRKELVQVAINEGLDRKNDLLLELGSF